MGTKNRSILFYDGDCGFCSQAVSWAMRLEKNQDLKFAPLLGESAQELLPPYLTASKNSMILIHGDKLYMRTQAAIYALRIMGRPLLAWLLWAVPFALRDKVYSVIATHRMRLAGDRVCALPAPSRNSRFLP